MTNNQSKKAIIIDGHSLAYRAFFATTPQLKYFQDNKLPPTNALRMIIIMISKLLNAQPYDYGLVAFDTSRKSFRTEQFEDYKSNRKPMPDELVYQMPLIIEALKLFGFKIIAIENYEADDVIATFAHLCTQNEIKNEIFSSDQDLLQLVNACTSVNLLKKGVSDIKVYNDQNFMEQIHGLTPKQFVELKAISGDSSDNYKGVEGVGSKTAIKLMQKYGSIENIYNNLDEVSAKLKTKLINGKANLDLCWKIATISTEVLIPSDLENYFLKKAQQPEIETFLKQYNVMNLLQYF